MKTVELYYDDLNEKGKEKIQKAIGCTSTEEGNWDVIPLATIDFEENYNVQDELNKTDENKLVFSRIACVFRNIFKRNR